MLNEKEIKSMLYLLDDPDERVSEEIKTRIVSMGKAVIPLLEEASEWEGHQLRLDIMLNLIKTIEAKALCRELEDWKQTENRDLLEGVLIIDKLYRPDLDKQMIDNQLDKIKLDAWLELKYDLTSFEKIKILNYIFFDLHRFKGDTENYHESKNSFISHVLEAKRGNPVSLAIIYSIIAQRLNIPVFGVNLPQHFVLGYINDVEWHPLKQFNDQPLLRDEQGSDVMFYINPFNSGLIFSRENILQFLKQLNLEPKESYFKICGSIDILQRILRNLVVAYEQEENTNKLQLVKEMLAIVS